MQVSQQPKHDARARRRVPPGRTGQQLGPATCPALTAIGQDQPLRCGRRPPCDRGCSHNTMIDGGRARPPPTSKLISPPVRSARDHPGSRGSPSLSQCATCLATVALHHSPSVWKIAAAMRSWPGGSHGCLERVIDHVSVVALTHRPAHQVPGGKVDDAGGAAP